MSMAFAAYLMISHAKSVAAAQTGQKGQSMSAEEDMEASHFGGGQEEEGGVEVGRTRAMPYTITMAMLFFQILGVLGTVAYIPLSRATLILFDCTKLPNGEYRLDADLGEKCFGSMWWSLFPAGIAGVVLYVLLVPGY